MSGGPSRPGSDDDDLDYRVHHVLKAIFPNGTPQVWRLVTGTARKVSGQWKLDNAKLSELPTQYVSTGQGQWAQWQAPPSDPVDAFAIGAILMTRSGAYHHVQTVDQLSRTAEICRILRIGDRRRDLVTKAGETWRQSYEVRVAEGMQPKPRQNVEWGLEFRMSPPPMVQRAWRHLLKSAKVLGEEAEVAQGHGLKVFEPLARSDKPPSWWWSAYVLLSVADEASRNLGMGSDRTSNDIDARIPLLFQMSMNERLDTNVRVGGVRPSTGGHGGRKKISTISKANPDILCILPKSRTPGVGCTMRSMSHNLASLPARGLARAHWLSLPSESLIAGPDEPLNLLLVPYPYRLGAHHFRRASSSSQSPQFAAFTASPGSRGSEDDVQRLLHFVNELIDAGEADMGVIHGVIFPELALSHRVYAALSERLRRYRPRMELLVSGLHSYDPYHWEWPDGPNDADRHGNWSAMTIFAGEAGEREALPDEREKHHRWILDPTQIATYSLGSALNPSNRWYEALDITSRSLTVATLRRKLTVTSLICEDLARVDPAQELIRAIGPNLIIALLMDGPQLEKRWAGRYAGVLSEDPGSSVLTFTSLGLIERTNATMMHDSSRCIALWRDDTGAKPLKLPPDQHALVITLTSRTTEEFTLDGRRDQFNAETIQLTGVLPVSATGFDRRALLEWFS